MSSAGARIAAISMANGSTVCYTPARFALLSLIISWFGVKLWVMFSFKRHMAARPANHFFAAEQRHAAFSVCRHRPDKKELTT